MLLILRKIFAVSLNNFNWITNPSTFHAPFYSSIGELQKRTGWFHAISSERMNLFPHSKRTEGFWIEFSIHGQKAAETPIWCTQQTFSHTSSIWCAFDSKSQENGKFHDVANRVLFRSQIICWLLFLLTDFISNLFSRNWMQWPS